MIPFDAVVHDVAGFARGDLRQPAGRRFVDDLRAPFALRRENVDRPLAQIILHVAREPDDLDIVPPIFFRCGLASSWTEPTSQSSASFKSSRCQASSR